MTPRVWFFAGGKTGQFAVSKMSAVRGEPLPSASRLYVGQEGGAESDAAFTLRGTVSNERYTTREEKTELLRRQVAIGREEARQGAFIAIKKNEAWWALTQDERRAVFEEQSSHIKIGLGALPQVARRLHHCRDLDEAAPFDFLTWFDFQASDVGAFDDLLGALRCTEEWKYIEREVELRVERIELGHGRK